jgi:hypothetical protein
VLLYIFIIVGHQVSIDEGNNSTCFYHETFERFEKGGYIGVSANINSKMTPDLRYIRL